MDEGLDMLTFKFEGFEPTPDLKSKAKEVLWHVEEKAPSESFHHAVLKKIPDGYIGLIKVSSQVGVFEAEVTDKTPEIVLEGLYRKLKKDLTLWKKDRLNFV